MKNLTLHYPNDKPQAVQQLSRKEFLEAYPREPTTITVNGVLVETIDVPPDFIACDLCASDPGNLIYVLGAKAFCDKCYTMLYKKYTHPTGEQN